MWGSEPLVWGLEVSFANNGVRRRGSWPPCPPTLADMGSTATPPFANMSTKSFFFYAFFLESKFYHVYLYLEIPSSEKKPNIDASVAHLYMSLADECRYIDKVDLYHMAINYFVSSNTSS